MYFVEAGTLVVLKQIEGDEKKVRRRKYFLIYSVKNVKFCRLTRFSRGDTLESWVSSTTPPGRPPCPPGMTSKWHVGTHYLYI